MKHPRMMNGVMRAEMVVSDFGDLEELPLWEED